MTIKTKEDGTPAVGTTVSTAVEDFTLKGGKEFSERQ